MTKVAAMAFRAGLCRATEPLRSCQMTTEAAKTLDRGLDAEAEQGDGAGGQAGGDRDGAFDEVPDHDQPGQ
ncbi:MAG TPA: hypothetical protein VFK43_07795 [Acidimicrobiales bacterium]|nr:hypothetical protein [Acidimicrobiales bacterium]